MASTLPAAIWTNACNSALRAATSCFLAPILPHLLLAPDLFAPELTSAERQGRIKAGESVIFLHDIRRAAPALHPTPPLLLRAMAQAIAIQRTALASVMPAPPRRR